MTLIYLRSNRKEPEPKTQRELKKPFGFSDHPIIGSPDLPIYSSVSSVLISGELLCSFRVGHRQKKPKKQKERLEALLLLWTGRS